MLSVLIEMRDDDGAGLALTLGCLVPAAVEGIVREVVLLDGGIGPQVRRVAEEAGCAIRPALELGDVLAGARGEWVLMLEAGSEPLPGWAEAATRHIARSAYTGQAARFRQDTVFGLGLTRLFVPSRLRRARRGVLVPRLSVNRLFRIGMRLDDLAARVRTRRLPAVIIPRDASRRH